MPFITIKGSYRLINRTKNGNPTGFEPDGDSMQFRPDKPKLLDRLQRLMSPYRLTAIKSTQLRFEGIDALELHFTAAKGGVTHQPRPLADQARDHLVTKANLDPVHFKAPENIRVQPPAPHDSARGYILSRSLEVHGRPVSFAFAGDPPGKDGAEVYLDAPLLRKSLNYEMLVAGEAYPLFYDTLFAELRAELAIAAQQARAAGRGIWEADRTLIGTPSGSIAQLEITGVVFPKLFRRLTEFFGDGEKKLSKFKAWVAARQERVWDLDTSNNTHFDTYIDVSHSVVKLTKSPARLVFVSAQGKAPWL
jgi:endonuclease YncB( thermonuclease family)